METKKGFRNHSTQASGSSHSAAQLLHRCAPGANADEGHEAAWRLFIRRYGRHLARAIRRTLRECGESCGRDVVEELRQEVYCRLLERDGQRLRNFRGSSDTATVHAYLGAIARSVVVDDLRRRSALKRGGGLQRCAIARSAFEFAPDAARPTPCPEQRAIAREGLRALIGNYAAETDTSQLRRSLQVLRWALVEGWSSREIAAALPGRLTPGSVDSMLYRLRRRLTEAAA
jgi:DNA-directed RNA polymerase specialized sigma24 family protein